jgi:Fe-S cluster assembly iron-binding protein IscA
MKKTGIIAFFLLLMISISSRASAQTYYFQLSQLLADVFINQDGTTSIAYAFTFDNNPSASPIDYVDVGMPDSGFSLNGATAQVNSKSVSLSRSEYQGGGSGFAVVLGSSAILPGQTGTVTVSVPDAGSWLRYDSNDKTYASLVFSPTWFGSQYVYGTTAMQVVFHFPPGVQSEEPRWHVSPSGWASEPQTGVDDQGRMIYIWSNAQASASSQYSFGASFPAKYVPASAIVKPSFFETLGISTNTIFSVLCCGGILVFMFGIGWISTNAAKKRKLQYLSPKISIEGMGIKRGLTAVEAAILMEQPLDKVMTMILFGVIKKNAASVITRDPLEISVVDPIPEGLNPYEADFLKAFQIKSPPDRRKALQTMTIDLVNSVSNKMKGFSRKETTAYYKDIIEKAWKQVESAQTPEVKSQTYDKYLEWTMLDKNYDDRTKEVFHGGPVFVPIWWGHYDPTFHTPMPAASGAPGPSGGGLTMPTLPGATFAASMVNGVQNFSASVIGNITDFTDKITSKTNPVPVSTTPRSFGGTRSGGGCACACACAGCACACAGGGR